LSGSETENNQKLFIAHSNMRTTLKKKRSGEKCQHNFFSQVKSSDTKLSLWEWKAVRGTYQMIIKKYFRIMWSITATGNFLILIYVGKDFCVLFFSEHVRPNLKFNSEKHISCPVKITILIQFFVILSWHSEQQEE
jgi:hypothetical protein